MTLAHSKYSLNSLNLYIGYIGLISTVRLMSPYQAQRRCSSGHQWWSGVSLLRVWRTSIVPLRNSVFPRTSVSNYLSLHPPLKAHQCSDSPGTTILCWWGYGCDCVCTDDRECHSLSFLFYTALAATGFIWVRYSLVITPVNYSLAAVSTPFLVTIYHLYNSLDVS